MADLVEQMRALRDRKGLVLADALVRQAARDSIGTVESLGSRFMLAGLPQPPEVLRQLVDLRNEASRGGPLPPLKVQQTPDGPFVVGGAGFYWLHTHDGSGVVHVESPVERPFTLGELFDLWGQPLGPDRVGPARGPVTALVDGVVVGGDPRDIPLTAHATVQLDVGTVVPFRPYSFPPGL